MANTWYEWVHYPVIEFTYWLRTQFDCFCTWFLTIWPEHRPLHTYGFAFTEPEYSRVQKNRTISFYNRMSERVI